MTIRAAQRSEDGPEIWSMLEPVLKAGETYALPQDWSESEALDYWFAPDKSVFVTEDIMNGELLGVYYLKPNQFGGGSHVCNCGYVTAPLAQGRGVARAMAEHSFDEARRQGFRAMQYNFVIATNTRAVSLWQRYGFEIVGTLPEAYDHPRLGYVDALVMFKTL